METKELQELVRQIAVNIKKLQQWHGNCIESVDCQCLSCIDDFSIRKKEENCIRSIDFQCESCLKERGNQVEVIESMGKSATQEDQRSEDVLLSEKDKENNKSLPVKVSHLKTYLNVHQKFINCDLLRMGWHVDNLECNLAHDICGKDWESNGSLNPFDELLELEVVHILCLFDGSSYYVYEEKNDGANIVFDPGGKVFDWLNQLTKCVKIEDCESDSALKFDKWPEVDVDSWISVIIVSSDHKNHVYGLYTLVSNLEMNSNWEHAGVNCYLLGNSNLNIMERVRVITSSVDEVGIIELLFLVIVKFCAASLACGSNKANDEPNIIFDPGGVVFRLLYHLKSSNEAKNCCTCLIFSVLEIPLIVYSLDCAKLFVHTDAKIVKNWSRKQFNGALNVYWRNIKDGVREKDGVIELLDIVLADLWLWWDITKDVGWISCLNDIVHRSVVMTLGKVANYKASLVAFEMEEYVSLSQGVRANNSFVIIGIIEVDPIEKGVAATYSPCVLRSTDRSNLHWKEWVALKQIHSLQFVLVTTLLITQTLKVEYSENFSFQLLKLAFNNFSHIFIFKNLSMTLVIGNLELFGSVLDVHTQNGDLIHKLSIFWVILSIVDGILEIGILVSSPLYFLLNICKLVTLSASFDCWEFASKRTLGKGTNIVDSHYTCAAMKTLGLPEEIESESQRANVKGSRGMFPECEKFREIFQLVPVNATIMIFHVSVVDMVDVETSIARFFQAGSLQGYFFLSTAIIKKLGANTARIWTSLTEKGPSKRFFERKYFLANDLLAAISHVHRQRLTPIIQCAIKALGFGDTRKDNLERDVINEECSSDLSNVQANMIGSAKKSF